MLRPSKLALSICAVLAALTLSACSSTSELLSFDSPDLKAEEIRENQRIDDHLEEWDTLKPRLVEIVKLESELRYLIEQISATELSSEVNISMREPVDNRFSDPNFSMSEEIEAALDMSIEQKVDFEESPDAEVVAQMDMESEQQIIENFDNETHQNIAKKFEEQPDSDTVASTLKLNNTKVPAIVQESAVEIGRAQPVGASNASIPAVIDSKFSNAGFSATPQSSNLKQASSQVSNATNLKTAIVGTSTNASFSNTEGVSDNKFKGQGFTSSQVSKANNLKLASCSAPSAPQLGGAGIHLVSYSSFDAAAKGWESLQSKFPSALCDKRAAIKEVSVKGKQYFAVRVGPYQSAESAQQACSPFLRGNQYCQRSTFEGVLTP